MKGAVDCEKVLANAVRWLDRSISQNQGKGSSAYFHIINGWSRPYPETTGYIIPTLYSLSKLDSYDYYAQRATALADWLLSIQNEDGSFPQGLSMGQNPEIFDNGQILFGLLAAYKDTQNQQYRIAVNSLVSWMLKQQNANGAFDKSTYVNSYSPSYHIRFIWALILSMDYYENKVKLENSIQIAFEYYSSLILPNGAFRNCGFNPGDSSLTHTIAYTIRGFLECGLLLKDNKWIELILPTIEMIEKKMSETTYLAGEYNTDWIGNNTFRCLTGEAQLSIIFRRLYQLYKLEKYNNAADKLLEQISSKQCHFPMLKNLDGGFFASAPFYGKYMRFMMNNWTVKFHIDAVLMAINPDTELFG